MNFNLPVTDDKEKAQAALDAAVSEYESALCDLVKYALTNNLYLYIDGHGALLKKHDGLIKDVAIGTHQLIVVANKEEIMYDDAIIKIKHYDLREVIILAQANIKFEIPSRKY